MILPALKSKDVIRALQRAGFFIHHGTIAYRNRDLKNKTLAVIIEQTAYTQEEFVALP